MRAAPESFQIHATRLAPSPTGALHLGNARTFLVTWATARARGWRVILRIEDLDGPRIDPAASRGAIETLLWLGMDWDDGPIFQSADLEPYRMAMRDLATKGFVYPSELSRREIEEATSAPQEGSHEVVFPASLRPADVPRTFADDGANWRFATPDDIIEFHDEFMGPQRMKPGASIGDFVVWTKRGQPAYQLAVVVDDHRQGVTQVVRGNDLLDSAGRQILLYRALDLGPQPIYTHLPLVRGPDGRRLAKRHGDTRISAYQARGVSAERVIGLLARWCGIDATGAMSAAEFTRALDVDRIPRDDVVFTPEDDAWLLADTRFAG